jgi:hypothetical protein
MSERTYETLEYDGTEKSFAEWKFSNVRTQFRSLAPDMMMMRQTVQSVDDGPVFPFEAEVIVRRGRVKTVRGYEGGRVWFVGYRLNAPAAAAPGEQAFNYTFANAIYLLQEMHYRQAWYSGITTHLLLGINQAGEYVRSGGVLKDVIDFAASDGIKIAAGTIEPGLFLPISERTDLPCPEAMKEMARWVPDGVGFADYTTFEEDDVVTFHFMRRANLPALTFAVPRDRTSGTEVTPRYDLKKDYCLLLFERIDDVDGSQSFKVFPQIAPAGHPGTGRRGYVSTINLRGAKQSMTEVMVRAIDHAPGDVDVQAAASDYWKAKNPALLNGFWRNGKITFRGMIDEDGNATQALYLNELIDGSLNEQMGLPNGDPVAWQKVRLAYEVQYDHYDAAVQGTLINRAKENLFVDVTLTNATTGIYRYASEGADPGEPLAQFAGMAQYLLNATKDLQFEGQHVLLDVDDALAGAVGDGDPLTWLGKVLNLTNADPAWTAMRALITQVDYNHDSRQVTLKFGPAPHLEKGDLLDLTRNNRNRNHTTPPKTRSEGVSADGKTLLGQVAPNTSQSSQGQQYSELVLKGLDGGSLTLTPNKITMVAVNAQGQEISRVEIGTGATQKIFINGNDLPANAIVKFNATDGCSGKTKQTKQVLREN